MPKLRLQTILLRHWLVFAALAALFVSSGALLLAYVIEDGLIDRRLLAAEQMVRNASGDIPVLPPDVSFYSEAEIPMDIHARLQGAGAGKIVEFRRPNRSYVHALTLGGGAGGAVLVYDASGALVVGPSLARAVLAAVLISLFFIAAAGLVAQSLSRKVGRDVETLLHDLRGCSTPGMVRDLGERQRVAELSEFLSIHAHVWDERVRVLEDEQQMLGYLAHELRTPLQSARNSLAVLCDETPSSEALRRLDRALSRLTRASNAALWLTLGSGPAAGGPVALLASWRDLTDELEPLASRVGKSFVHLGGPDPVVHVPAEVVEAILSNLIVNALRHGAPGLVELETELGGFALRNPVDGSCTSGFGLGHPIVRRLCGRAGWQLSVLRQDAHFEARVDFGTEAKS